MSISKSFRKMAPPRRSTRLQTARLRHTVSAPPISFTLFPKLPLELRLQIFEIRIHQDARKDSSLVTVLWDANLNEFWSPRRPAPLLHACKESRIEALKVYQLCFATQRGPGKVYFSSAYDILVLNWYSLGRFPWRLGEKLSDDECSKVQSLVIVEDQILLHAEEDMIELSRFTSLECMGVICDEHDWGNQNGDEAMTELAEEIDKGIGDPNVSRTERWPTLICLRTNDDLPPCSRHWWFDGWNQRTCIKQRYK